MIISDNKEKYKKFQVSLFIVGMLLTISTSGPLMIFSSLAVYYFFSRKKKLNITTILICIAFIGVAYYVMNYMPFFGKQAKMEISADAEESIEIHDNLFYASLIPGLAFSLASYLSMKYKNNKTVFITIASLMCLGIFANYIAYTVLFTAFFFWDSIETSHNTK